MKRFSVKALAVLGWLLLACGSDPATELPESGTIELAWQLGLGVPCDDQALGTPVKAVHLVAMQAERAVTTATFSCALGAAAVSVPIGEYDLALAEDAKKPRYSGTRSKVTVAKDRGQKVSIILFKNPGPVGALSVQWALPTSLPCGALAIEKVHIDVIRDATILQFGGDFDCDGAATIADVPWGDYTILAEARNSAGHSLYRGKALVTFDGELPSPITVSLAP